MSMQQATATVYGFMVAIVKAAGAGRPGPNTEADIDGFRRDLRRAGWLVELFYDHAAGKYTTLDGRSPLDLHDRKGPKSSREQDVDPVADSRHAVGGVGRDQGGALNAVTIGRNEGHAVVENDLAKHGVAATQVDLASAGNTERAPSPATIEATPSVECPHCGQNLFLVGLVDARRRQHLGLAHERIASLMKKMEGR